MVSIKDINVIYKIIGTNKPAEKTKLNLLNELLAVEDSALTIDKLKNILKLDFINLPVSGNKPDLLERFNKYILSMIATETRDSKEKSIDSGSSSRSGSKKSLDTTYELTLADLSIIHEKLEIDLPKTADRIELITSLQQYDLNKSTVDKMKSVLKLDFVKLPVGGTKPELLERLGLYFKALLVNDNTTDNKKQKSDSVELVAEHADVTATSTADADTTADDEVDAEADDEVDAESGVGGSVLESIINIVFVKKFLTTNVCKQFSISNKANQTSKKKDLLCKFRSDNKLDQYLESGDVDLDLLYLLLVLTDEQLDAVAKKVGFSTLTEYDRFSIILNIIKNQDKFGKSKSGKTKIPPVLKEQLWEKYIGNLAKSQCYCCNSKEISLTRFDAGHIIAEANGGSCTIDNLRPICKSCNSSMGTNNMYDYCKQFFKDTPLLKEFAQPVG